MTDDKDLREAIAYALWRSPWRKSLASLHECRQAARDIERHLHKSRYRVEPGEPLKPHG
ncbi:hypothetical protein [Marinicauda algicola]|uniref:hypothetical protein n=1 Tax=Marinicauda algicola TaxID=2029849 RepID=UPI0013050DC7|nr:hypothetical protein [Marinicauda algicola]